MNQLDKILILDKLYAYWQHCSLDMLCLAWHMGTKNETLVFGYLRKALSSSSHVRLLQLRVLCGGTLGPVGKRSSASLGLLSIRKSIHWIGIGSWIWLIVWVRHSGRQLAPAFLQWLSRNVCRGFVRDRDSEIRITILWSLISRIQDWRK